MKFLDSSGLSYFWSKTKAYANTAAAKAVPSGVIVMWSGSAGNVPAGWTLCNGSSGTPDLRGRFVLGGGGTYNPGATGGEETVTLTKSQIPSHTHKLFVTESGFTGSGMDVFSYGQAGAYTSDFTGTNSGGGGAHNNMPPYYALCYIMKQ